MVDAAYGHLYPCSRGILIIPLGVKALVVVSPPTHHQEEGGGSRDSTTNPWNAYSPQMKGYPAQVRRSRQPFHVDPYVIHEIEPVLLIPLIYHGCMRPDEKHNIIVVSLRMAPTVNELLPI